MEMGSKYLKVDVCGTEDYIDTNNRVVTHYIVKITTPSTTFEIRKRYSDFFGLYYSLQNKCPQLANFAFPNKSIFHTHSDFTIERRKQTFDDMLKILVRMNPRRVEVEEFLQVDDERDDPPVEAIPAAVANVSLGGSKSASGDSSTYPEGMVDRHEKMSQPVFTLFSLPASFLLALVICLSLILSESLDLSTSSRGTFPNIHHVFHELNSNTDCR